MSARSARSEHRSHHIKPCITAASSIGFLAWHVTLWTLIRHALLLSYASALRICLWRADTYWSRTHGCDALDRLVDPPVVRDVCRPAGLQLQRRNGIG